MFAFVFTDIQVIIAKSIHKPVDQNTVVSMAVVVINQQMLPSVHVLLEKSGHTANIKSTFAKM